jgi:hypothetical protein
MKGLPNYCKNQYTHNPRSSARAYSTGNTSIINCPSCKKLRKLRKQCFQDVIKNHTNPLYSKYILRNGNPVRYDTIYNWLEINHSVEFDKDFPVRCDQHKQIGRKRRFGSGFTRRRWKQERHLNGGKN